MVVGLKEGVVKKIGFVGIVGVVVVSGLKEEAGLVQRAWLRMGIGQEDNVMQY